MSIENLTKSVLSHMEKRDRGDVQLSNDKSLKVLSQIVEAKNLQKICRREQKSEAATVVFVPDLDLAEGVLKAVAKVEEVCPRCKHDFSSFFRFVLSQRKM